MNFNHFPKIGIVGQFNNVGKPSPCKQYVYHNNVCKVHHGQDVNSKI